VTSYGTVQVDVDGWWAYCAAYGEQAPLDPDPVFREALPRLRAALDRYGIRATLFVVGADLSVSWKRRLIVELARDGHEIANHTFHHPLGLPHLTHDDLLAEIVGAEDAISEAVGRRPVGFRAPGYAAHETIYAHLAARGYLYDSSLLPTFWGGLIRAFQARGACRTARAQGAATGFGRFVHGFAPLGPYRPDPSCLWRRGDGELLEVPVTTMPLIRFPFHSTCAYSLGLPAFRAGLTGCRMTGTPINYLFHAIDLIGDASGEPMLRRLGIRAPFARRQQMCDAILCELSRTFELIPTREWIARLTHPAAAAAARPMAERAR
jgi:hypothetical protein